MHSEELDNMYSSRNIILMNQSRGMRWAGNAVCKVETKMHVTLHPETVRAKGRWRETEIYDTKMYLTEIQSDILSWIKPAENSAMVHPDPVTHINVC